MVQKSFLQDDSSHFSFLRHTYSCIEQWADDLGELFNFAIVTLYYHFPDVLTVRTINPKATIPEYEINQLIQESLYSLINSKSVTISSHHRESLLF